MRKPAAPPRTRLPSLDLLKGFEAAARHLSFTRAAEELFLTQSALSRQMQTLEEQLGLPLFERRHRQHLPTEAGPRKRPEDLAQSVLWHLDGERGRFAWPSRSAWLAAIGIDHLARTGSRRLNHFDQVIQAAVAGQGVALGGEPLIDHLLQQRKLVA